MLVDELECLRLAHVGRERRLWKLLCLCDAVMHPHLEAHSLRLQLLAVAEYGAHALSEDMDEVKGSLKPEVRVSEGALRTAQLQPVILLQDGPVHQVAFVVNGVSFAGRDVWELLLADEHRQLCLALDQRESLLESRIKVELLDHLPRYLLR